jgi:GAF domain-containing protein
MKDSELGRVYSEGDIIFKEGDVGDRMYVIQSGRVKITKDFRRHSYCDYAGIFGEMALSDRPVHPAAATNKNIGHRQLQTISRYPTLVFKMIESMSRRIRRLDEEFTKLKKNKLDLQIFANVDETCKFILDESKNFIHADNGSIMLLGEEDEPLFIRAAFGSEWKPKTKLCDGEGIAGDVLRTGKSELINNVSMDPRYKSGETRIKSLLCVPLKGKSRNFGVINLSRGSEKLFSIEELKLLRTVAIYASIAIENAMIFSKLNTATDEILRHATMLDMWS